MSVQNTEKLLEAELCPEEMLSGQEAAFARDIERLRLRFHEFVNVSCPACSSANRAAAFEKYGFHYLQCHDCQTIYMSPRPSPAVMAAYYGASENYRFWADNIFPASEVTRREKINRPWLERIVSLTQHHRIPRKHLVEVGAGFGTFCALAGQERMFEKVTAIEPTPEMAEACRQRGVDVLEAGIEQVVDQVAPADVVVAFEVVEHLFEPIAFFRQVAKLLRPGGLLVVSCPNGLGFDISVLGPLSQAVDPEHVNLMNPKSLSYLAARSGLETLETGTPGRLDAELVRIAVLKKTFSLKTQPFLQQVLIDQWENKGWAFQCFLAENGLSSHMFGVFRRPDPALPDTR